MPKFRLLPGCGKHTTSDGKKITRPGTVFEEDAPLDKMFSNKFERVGEKTAKMPDYYDGPGADEVMDDSLLQRQKKKAVKGEEERPTPSRQTSKFKKAIITDDEDDHKVEDVGENDGEEDEIESEDEDSAEPDADKEDEAEDLTEKFPKAKTGGLKVLKAKDGYHVVDSDGDYLNEKPLKFNQVQKTISENVKADE